MAPNNRFISLRWSNSLRDVAYRAAFQNYTLAVFLYVLMLMTAGKSLGLGLEYYGFRLERRFQQAARHRELVEIPEPAVDVDRRDLCLHPFGAR